MRMARVNITIPDELLEGARAAGLNVSRVTASALSEELDRRAKTAALDGYLRELDVALGPVSAEDEAAARDWADRAFDAGALPASVRARRAS
jgi:post-segregation antitoxin CcdA